MNNVAPIKTSTQSPAIGEGILDIANKIKDGSWPRIEPNMDLSQFVKPAITSYVLRTELQLQSRTRSLNMDFCDMAISGINENPEQKKYLKMPVVVYFKNEVEYEGNIYPANSYGLLDGNHGVVIKTNVGLMQYDAYCVHFELDLNGELANIQLLGNFLNIEEERTVGLAKEDIAKSYYAMIDGAIARGDKTPSRAEDEIFIESFSSYGINNRTLGQWKSNHEDGARSKKSIKEYDKEMLAAELERIKNMKAYKDVGWAVMAPSTIPAYNGAALGDMVKNLTQQDVYKCVMIFYAADDRQKIGIDTNDKVYGYDHVRKFFDNVQDWFGNGCKIEVIYLATS